MDESVNEARNDPPYTPYMRMLAIVDSDRLDIAALIWMVGVLVYVGSEILFAALLTHGDESFSQTGGGWFTLYQISHTVDLAVLGALVIGLAIAAAFDSVLSRAAALLGVVGGVWALVAGFLRLLYQVSAPDKQQAHGQWSFEYGTAFVMMALGTLVAIGALRLYTTVRYDFDEEDEGGDDDEVEAGALS